MEIIRLDIRSDKYCNFPIEIQYSYNNIKYKFNMVICNTVRETIFKLSHLQVVGDLIKTFIPSNTMINTINYTNNGHLLDQRTLFEIKSLFDQFANQTFYLLNDRLCHENELPGIKLILNTPGAYLTIKQTTYIFGLTVIIFTNQFSKSYLKCVYNNLLANINKKRRLEETDKNENKSTKLDDQVIENK